MTTATGWVPEDDFATRLLLARKHSGLTVREAALRCGMHYATWSTWERGARPADMAAIVDQISQGLGVDRAWLAWGGPLSPESNELGQGVALTRKRTKSSNKWFRPRTQRNAGRYSRKKALTMTATHRGRPAA